MKNQMLREKALAEAALVWIIEHPKTWDQWEAHSGLKGQRCGCFIHHCIKIGRGIAHDTIGDNITVAARLLGTSYGSTDRLFSPLNTLLDLKLLCREIFGLKSVRLSNGKRIRL